MPLGRLLVGVRQREHVDLAEARPPNCSPMGRPSRLKPHGTVMAGMPYPLNGAVFRIRTAVASIGDAIGASMLTGSSTSVGVTKTSTSSNAAATAFLTSAS